MVVDNPVVDNLPFLAPLLVVPASVGIQQVLEVLLFVAVHYYTVDSLAVACVVHDRHLLSLWVGRPDIV